MTFADSHCHLTDRAFDRDRAAAVQRAGEAGVTRMVSVASSAADARAALELAERFPDRVWCTAGVHPHRAGEGDDMDVVRSVAASDRCVAVGETGLDYHYDHAPRSAQRRSFERHLALADELAMPAVVHSRDAEADTAAAIRDVRGRVTGVLHCFTGSRDLMALALDAGWWVSFTGIATFKGFDEELPRRAPRDRYMVETDAPYLAPEPKRGRRNEPAFLPHVVARIADARGESVARVARDTRANAVRFFGLNADEAP